MIVMAAAIAVVCVVDMVLLETLVVDFAAVAVYFLGGAVAKGSRRAAKWLLFVMLFYVAMALLFVIAIELGLAPDRLRGSSRPVATEYLPWIQIVFAVLGVWAAVCAGLLIRGLWQTCATLNSQRT